MVFGQLTNLDSLCDLILIIDAHSQKSYHLGFGKSVTRSNLAKANERRSCKLFEEFAYYLVDIARKKQANDGFAIKGKVYAFDSSTIDLCLSVLLQEMNAKFDSAYKEIRQQVELSNVVGTDESGANVNGKLRWTWVWQTSGVTYAYCNESRGRAAIDDHFYNGYRVQRWLQIGTVPTSEWM